MPDAQPSLTPDLSHPPIIQRATEILTLGEWLKRAKKGGVKDGDRIGIRTLRSSGGLRKGAFDGPVDAPGAAPRTLKWIISSDREDRYRDIVDQGPDAMELDEYNGVWLWDHNYGGWDSAALPPIGKSAGFEYLSRAGVNMTAGAVTMAGKAQNHELAETLYLLAQEDFIPDVSIGFTPDEWTYEEDRQGYHFLKWDLNEVSLVPIGANLDVERLKMTARTKGISLAPMLEWAQKALDAEGQIVVPRETLGAVAKALGDSRGVKIFDLKGEELKTIKAAEPPPAPAAAVVKAAVELDEIGDDDASTPAADAATEQQTCQMCKGEGKVPVTCSLCKGTGKVDAPTPKSAPTPEPVAAAEPLKGFAADAAVNGVALNLLVAQLEKAQASPASIATMLATQAGIPADAISKALLTVVKTADASPAPAVAEPPAPAAVEKAAEPAPPAGSLEDLAKYDPADIDAVLRGMEQEAVDRLTIARTGRFPA